MLDPRCLRRIAITLLCLWISGLLVAVSDLFEDSVSPFDYQSYGYGDGDLDSNPLRGLRRQQLKESIRKRHAKMLERRKRMHDERHDEQGLDENPAMNLVEKIVSQSLNASLQQRMNNQSPMNRSHTHRRHRKHHRLLHRSSDDQDSDSSSSPSMLLPKPVIVVGFPKAGTSSIFQFFRSQREQYFKCQHWYCCGNQFRAQSGGPGLMSACMLKNLNRNRSIFHNCGNFDVYAEINGPRPIVWNKSEGIRGLLLDDGELDLEDSFDPREKFGKRMFFPQYFNLDDIHKHYPNATFILNTRPFDSWIHSVQSWADGETDWHFVNEFYHRGELDSLPEDKNNDTEMALIMRDIYDRHHARVRQFVQDNPSHAMVEVPILDPNAGKILGDAFGLDPKRWGQVNVNGGVGENQQIVIDFLQELVPNFGRNRLKSLYLIASLAIIWSLGMTLGLRYIQRKYFQQNRRRR